jgi:hypothetical protein
LGISTLSPISLISFLLSQPLSKSIRSSVWVQPTLSSCKMELRPHTAYATRRALHKRAIRLLWWLANSPDLNPIENVGRLLKARVQKRFPRTEEEKTQVIKEEWERLQPQAIRKYCLNMKDKCLSVLKAGGGHTRF